jgi:hypothetical protein
MHENTQASSGLVFTSSVDMAFQSHAPGSLPATEEARNIGNKRDLVNMPGRPTERPAVTFQKGMFSMFEKVRFALRWLIVVATSVSANLNQHLLLCFPRRILSKPLFDWQPQTLAL